MLNFVFLSDTFCKCASFRVWLCSQRRAFMHGFVLCGMMLMLHSLLNVFGKCTVFDLLLNACCTCLSVHMNKDKTSTQGH